MAKETKVERDARMEREQKEVWYNFVEAYPTRFAALMFSYMELSHANFRVEKLGTNTYNFTREDYLYRSLVLPVTAPLAYNFDVMDAVETLEAALADYAREVAETQRKYQVKQAALAKLSAEERELLGV